MSLLAIILSIAVPAYATSDDESKHPSSYNTYLQIKENIKNNKCENKETAQMTYSTKTKMFVEYDWNDRTIKYHRAQVRDFFDFREATTKDAEDMADWLCQQTLFHDHEMEHLKVEVYCRFQELQIEPPPS